MVEKKVSVGLPKAKYEALCAEAIKRGLRKPGEKGSKGLAPLLKEQLAAQKPQENMEPLEVDFLSYYGKACEFWAPVSRNHAAKFRSKIVAIDEQDIAMRMADNSVVVYARDAILALRILQEEM